jgi:hypothetical protein
MKAGEAKLLYESGAIFDARICRSASGEGWYIKFKSKKPVQFSLELESERGPVRIFKKLYAAINAVERIGFNKATIILK